MIFLWYYKKGAAEMNFTILLSPLLINVCDEENAVTILHETKLKNGNIVL